MYRSRKHEHVEGECSGCQVAIREIEMAPDKAWHMIMRMDNTNIQLGALAKEWEKACKDALLTSEMWRELYRQSEKELSDMRDREMGTAMDFRQPTEERTTE